MAIQLGSLKQENFTRNFSILLLGTFNKIYFDFLALRTDLSKLSLSTISGFLGSYLRTELKLPQNQEF